MSTLAALFQIGSLGDSIVSVPVLRSLKELLPDCSDYVLVSRFDSHLNVMPASIFEMARAPKYHVSYRGSGSKLSRALSVAGAVAKLRYFGPKYCVYLMPSDRRESQVHRDREFFKTAGISGLIGFKTLPATTDDDSMTVRDTEAFLRFKRVWGNLAEEKFATYGCSPVIQPDNAAHSYIAQWLARHNIPRSGKRLVAICPYSNWSSKSWTPEVATDIVRQLKSILDVDLVLIGGDKDRSSANHVLAAAGCGINACGDFSPSQSAAFLQLCNLVICTDSGPMHLAGALGIPTVSTFSRISEDLGRWFPLGPNHTILYQDVKCAGCRLAVCPLPGHPCMKNITASEILASALDRLNGSPLFSKRSGTGTRSLSWQVCP